MMYFRVPYADPLRKYGLDCVEVELTLVPRTSTRTHGSASTCRTRPSSKTVASCKLILLLIQDSVKRFVRQHRRSIQRHQDSVQHDYAGYQRVQRIQPTLFVVRTSSILKFNLAVLRATIISTTFALSYGLSFAGITSTIVHAVLYFRKQIWVQANRSLHEQPDIHARLMSRYRQGP